MSKEQDSKNNYKVLGDTKVGEIQIANEVVATIAGISAMEADGVNSMAGNITNELAGKFGVKSLTKGVKVSMENNSVVVDMAINMNYGFNIPKTCNQVQDKVKQSIENMTGLAVSEVNVRIAGVILDNER